VPEHALASKLPVEDERRPARAVKQPSSVPPFGAGPVIWRWRTDQVALVNGARSSCGDCSVGHCPRFLSPEGPSAACACYAASSRLRSELGFRQVHRSRCLSRNASSRPVRGAIPLLRDHGPSPAAPLVPAS
jgi:hypothetical protein